MTARTLALTGLTSGVGARLAEIALEAGDQVAGLVRDPSKGEAARLGKLGVRLVRGDLDDTAALRDLSKGADAVFHLAAHVGDKGTLEQFERVNVQGTENVVRAAHASGVKRFVQLSSTAVYGRPDHGRVDETWPTKRIGVPYDDTKRDAEVRAFELGHELGLEVTAVRPPIIYGPYDRNFMPRAAEALSKRRFLLIDGGRAPLNVVWVDHVCDVMLRAAVSDGAPGEAFNVMDEVDRRPPSVREVVTVIAQEIGAPAPRLSLPYPVAMGLARVVAKAFALAKPDATPPLSPFVVKILTRDVIYDASKAARVLGFVPKVAALEGLRREARAFAERRRRGS
jgi:nucleoside-diphosphate-sugar epimerase